MLVGPVPEPSGDHEHRPRLRRRGGLGVLVAPLIALDSQTLAFQVVPALAAALLAGFTSFFIACFAGLAIGVDPVASPLLGDTNLVPDRRGGRADPRAARAVRLPGRRPRSLPARGEPPRPRRARREDGSPPCPAPSACSGRSVIARARRVVALVVFPYDFRQATDQLAARRRHLPLARRHRRLRRSDLRRAAGARRCRGFHDVPLDDRPRRGLGGVSDLASDRSHRRPPSSAWSSPSPRCGSAASASWS